MVRPYSHVRVTQVRTYAIFTWAGAGLMAPRSVSMALQASAPGELRGSLGRLGYLCAGVGKAYYRVMFVAAADLSMLSYSPP